MPHPTAERIVIIGGGAGGIVLATELGHKLGKRGLAEITLIDKHLTHIWKPLLHEVAAGSLNSYTDELNYFAHARKHHFRFLPGELSAINREQQQISLNESRDSTGTIILPARELGYDRLIIAIGSVCNDFNTTGARDNCLFMDSRQQAEYFHQLLIGRYLQAQRRDEKNQHLDICIVGAGATGVELSAELHHTARTLNRYGLDAIDAQQVRITLVEAAPRILPALPEAMAEAAHEELEAMGVRIFAGEKVTAIDPQALHTASGKVIDADIKVWSAGIKAPDFLRAIAGLETTPGNQLIVRDTLQTSRDEKIFALGDCASLTIKNANGDMLRIPPRAQSAYQQAKLLAKSLSAQIQHGTALQAFSYKDHGSLVSLSTENTVGNLMGNLFGTINIEGFIARMMYMMLYRMHQAALHGWPTTVLIMCRDLINRGTGPRLKLH